MCGIFGYTGPREAVQMAVKGLKKLEYRGYDSAGIAGIKDHKAFCVKDAGKISKLEKALENKNLKLRSAIAHTRWATHGKPNTKNAHPHKDELESIVVVHNGIIENYKTIKKKLEADSAKFISDTDTEVIPSLIASYYQGDILKALAKALSEMEGALAIALLHKDYPDSIIVACRESPLTIGCGEKEFFIASDPNAFIEYTRQVVYLEKNDIAVVSRDGLKIYDENLNAKKKDIKFLNIQPKDVSKGDFEHYTLKEIYDQPDCLRQVINTHLQEEYGTANFEELSLDVSSLLSISRILILGCGTSWHAGCLGAYLFEEMAHIPVEVEISSEYRYKNPVVQDNTLVIAISQSGETADTIAAMRELKAKGAKILGICNVEGSTIAREADHTIFLKAGPEIGVCSTKAFTSQVTILSLFAIYMARMRHMDKQKGQKLLKELKKIPDNVIDVLKNVEKIKALAEKYSNFNHFFFLGRSYMYPTCLEAALKIKEIAYVHAQGYPAGEMKHGPIALVDQNCPTIALCANRLTHLKLQSNLMEIKARSGPILAFAEAGSEGLDSIADDIFWLKGIKDEFASIPITVALQLFAYYFAKGRGADIDQPRNLAKSVTVE